MMGRKAISSKSVLQALADHHNDRTGLCYPGQRAIARQAGLLLGYVTTVVTRLESSNLIGIDKERRSWRYRLLFVERYIALDRPREFTPFDTVEQSKLSTTFDSVEQSHVLFNKCDCSNKPQETFESVGESVRANRTESLNLLNQGESAHSRDHHSPIAIDQDSKHPEFDELLKACLAAGIRGSDYLGMDLALEAKFRYTPTQAQRHELERQIIDRRGE